MTDEEIIKAMGVAVATVLPALVEQAIVKAMGVGAEETPLEPISPDPHRMANEESVRLAEEAKAAWDAMPAEDLAAAEAAAARTRYVDGIVSAVSNRQDPGVLAAYEEGLAADAIRDCRAEAHRLLAGDPEGQAIVESGLKSKKTRTLELLRALAGGKSTADQQEQLADLLAGA